VTNKKNFGTLFKHVKGDSAKAFSVFMKFQELNVTIS